MPIAPSTTRAPNSAELVGRMQKRPRKLPFRRLEFQRIFGGVISFSNRIFIYPFLRWFPLCILLASCWIYTYCWVYYMVINYVKSAMRRTCGRAAQSAPRRLQTQLMRVFLFMVMLPTIAFLGYLGARYDGGPGFLVFMPAAFFVMIAALKIVFISIVEAWVVNEEPPNGVDQAINWGNGETPGVTAVVIPIYNESVSRVYAAIEVMHRSLQQLGRCEHFQFYILSDSDQPDILAEEEAGWKRLVEDLAPKHAIRYRNRRHKVGMKAGNVADFLRRWGDDHCYMILLDADSLLAGQAMIKLVSLMEQNPQVAIAQLQSNIVLSETLYGRIEQWKQSVTAAVWDKARTVLAATVEGNYFGHNAIVRIAPFIDHGTLPVLPIKGPLGGRILSHDTVEWIFLSRAGWSIWSVAVENGSYEESPQTLEQHARRSCRWQLGDLQHMWIAFDKRFTLSERAHFASRCAYNLLEFFWWPACLVGMYLFANRVEGTHPAIRILIQASLAGVALLPFLKFLNFPIAVRNGQISRNRGGRLRTAASAFGAVVFSFLQLQLAGVYNILLLISLGRGVGLKWENQRSGYKNGGDRWLRVMRQYGLHAGLGTSVMAFTILTKPECVAWALLFSIGPIAATPLSILLESRRLGSLARKWGLFLTPEEQTIPAILRELNQALVEDGIASESGASSFPHPRWLTLVRDPEALRVHLGTLGRRRSHTEETARYFRELGRRLLEKGPGNLTMEEKWKLLRDHESLEWLHGKLVQQ